MPLTQLGRDQCLLYAFASPTVSRTGAWYAALFSGFPGDSGTSVANELSGNGYARQQLTGGNALTLTAHNITNSGAVTWTNSSATTAWSAFMWFGIADALTGGNLWEYGQISQAGQSFFLAACNVGNPGAGYAVNDTITITGGGGAVVTVDEVQTVNAVTGVPTKWHVSTHGSVASAPANPASTTTSGSGSGFTAIGMWLLEPTSIVLNPSDSYSLAASSIVLSLD